MINTHHIHTEVTSDFNSKSSISVICYFIEELRYNLKTFKATEVEHFVAKHRINWEYMLELSHWRGEEVYSKSKLEL